MSDVAAGAICVFQLLGIQGNHILGLVHRVIIYAEMEKPLKYKELDQRFFRLIQKNRFANKLFKQVFLITVFVHLQTTLTPPHIPL